MNILPIATIATIATIAALPCLSIRSSAIIAAYFLHQRSVQTDDRQGAPDSPMTFPKSDFQQIIDFWFVDIDPKQWWLVDQEFDRQVQERFGTVHARAAQCELAEWRTSPNGRLAEIIVLDQFSRNIYRGTAQAFASDPLALALAQEAIAVGAPASLEPRMKAFLYLPFMHSESREIHQTAVNLYGEAGLENNLAFEQRHKAIIDRFARYPHRNAALGRTSTAEEIEFLKTPGSSF
jgi:uncharacterized protein (DUF924 family)